MILVLVEHPEDELSQQGLTFARGLGEDVHALLVGDEGGAGLGDFGASVVHVADHPQLDSYAPAAWARCVQYLVEALSPTAVVGPGTDRGSEVLGHLAARLDQPMATNCVSLTPGEPSSVTRVRWGGSLLEESRLHGSPLILTVAPHAVAAESGVGVGATVERFTPDLSDADLVVRVSARESAATSGLSLSDADVVVSGGRGVGSAEGFAVIEELAGLLGAAVGCSRAVTMAGWRPHSEQVGQTGTKIAPELYIACGISGATQHMAGCRSAKKLLAINPDPEAPILSSADYAVIGDLQEVVPAISREIREAKST